MLKAEWRDRKKLTAWTIIFVPLQMHCGQSVCLCPSLVAACLVKCNISIIFFPLFSVASCWLCCFHPQPHSSWSSWHRKLLLLHYPCRNEKKRVHLMSRVHSLKWKEEKEKTQSIHIRPPLNRWNGRSSATARKNLSTNSAHSGSLLLALTSVPMRRVSPHALSPEASGRQCLTV